MTESEAEKLVKVTREAAKQSGMAYEFSPGSYTFSAMSACGQAHDIANHIAKQIQPDWIAAFAEYGSRR